MLANVKIPVSIRHFFDEDSIVLNAEEWRELMSKVASSNCHSSFRKIFDHFFPQVVGQGLKAGLDKELATELAQETLVRTWRQASSFDHHKGDVSLWIYIIARNLRYDHFRKLRNDPLNARSEDIFSPIDIEEKVQIEVLFDSKMLLENVGKLPREQAEVVRGIYIEGLTQEEVASIYNIPLGTVKSRIRLAIKSLKQMIKENVK